LAYIAYGKLLANGTPDELIRQVGFRTWRGEGAALVAQAARLEAEPGVELVTRFGNALHVSGRDAKAVEAAIARLTGAGAWQPIAPTLEDVFIFLMRGSEPAPNPRPV